MNKISDIFYKALIVAFVCTPFAACSDSDDDDNGEKEVYSPYISKVFEYCPAVGQFTNQYPEYKAGDTNETMRQKAEDAIAGPINSLISLGGFGGYVVFGFDHTIENVAGKRDFRIKANAFWAATHSDKRAGSCEPGIIMVAHDKNGNGKPDEDEWYEIAGSEYGKAETIRDYEITYYRPADGESATQFKWSDNKGVTEAYKVKNEYHSQNYFPSWITEDKITFKGTLLKNNAVNEAEEGTTTELWILYSYAWGYADNAPNNDDESAIDIDWAVDKNGNKANLPGIDFVKVYTGVNQEVGWLGEVSTEISGAEDLHMLGISINTRK